VLPLAVTWEADDYGLTTIEIYIDGKRGRSIAIQVRDPAELEGSEAQSTDPEG
jgi:hypothetical protein